MLLNANTLRQPVYIIPLVMCDMKYLYTTYHDYCTQNLSRCDNHHDI